VLRARLPPTYARPMRESGGALAKLLVALVVILVAASAALYVYGTRQRPLEFGRFAPAPGNEGADPSSVVLAADGTLSVATIVHNAGRLPVTLEGLGDQTADGPLVVTSLSLGDGHDATAPAAFSPVELDPGNGIGIVVVFMANETACHRLGNDPTAALPLPTVALPFSSYGVAATEEVTANDPPVVVGMTADACAGAAGSAGQA
jgi:hypothetical protein